MPTYNYRCKTCGDFEYSQSIKDNPLTTCPKCGGHEIKRLISNNVGIIFKGSGFYITDSRNSSNSASEPSQAS